MANLFVQKVDEFDIMQQIYTIDLFYQKMNNVSKRKAKARMAIMIHGRVLEINGG